ncbi:hypothetical protein WISP_145123 [Willisornis vidua]|uniref:Uncharacterized protein n=1 Tax=Willisornis vidua TaxID=1566151 RepID=A0ABQ9CQ53_9PASS|nr:hypothetical protein WISP_145123 [Willisornis vidua]
MSERRRSAVALSSRAHAFSVEALIGTNKKRKLRDWEDKGLDLSMESLSPNGQLGDNEDPTQCLDLNPAMLKPFGGAIGDIEWPRETSPSSGAASSWEKRDGRLGGGGSGCGVGKAAELMLSPFPEETIARGRWSCPDESQESPVRTRERVVLVKFL